MQNLHLRSALTAVIAVAWTLGGFGQGRLAAQEPAVGGLSIGTDSALNNEVAELPLLLSAANPADGFIMVFEWDARKAEGTALTALTNAGQPLEGADVTNIVVEDDFMILAVVMDVDGQGPATLPVGNDIQVGTASLRCICEGERQEIAVALPHRSRRSEAPGGPVLDNSLIVDGSALTIDDGLELENGVLVCNADGGNGEEPRVTCGDLDEAGNLVPAEGAAGEIVQLCYFYRAKVSDDPRERIQGLQISSSFDCQLSGNEDSASIQGTVLEEVNAEFLEVHTDNDPDDGDGCELVAGMLIDVMPPFDGRTLPGTESFRPLFCLDFAISAQADCGASLSVEFVDGLDGRGAVPINNLVSINNFDAPLQTTACAVTVVGSGGPRNSDFIRGDCNFNTRVNVADAAALVSHLFLTGEQSFVPPCQDACDANDDGALEISDAIFVLNFLFIPGSSAPPAPGATVAGPDPTEDELTCAPTEGKVCP